MQDYLIFFAIVLGINLLPAFGPPTWSIIALYGLNSDLSLPLLVPIGALAAALGRLLLALAFRHLGGRLPEKTRRNLEVAREALEKRTRNTMLAFGLFALSPVPSAQLFEAAGLAGVRLLGFTAAFAGRIISYAVYAYMARGISQSSIGETFEKTLTSPIGIAIQLVMIGLLVLLARIDWAKHLGAAKS